MEMHYIYIYNIWQMPLFNVIYLKGFYENEMTMDEV